MKVRKQMTNNKGITLIALVVTIVVLLILASISISMLTGESGIIAQAQKSKLQNEIGKEKEYIKLAFSAVKAEKISIGDTGDVTSAELQEEINNYTNDATVTGTGILKITYTSGREYEVDGTGKITSSVNNGEVSMDEMYNEEVIEEIAPEDLFEYEIIDDQIETARIVRIKPEYFNLQGYNPHTDSFDLTDTYGNIIYKGETISELLVIPYEATINGTKYKITEANIGATRKSFYMGSTTYYMGLPNVKWIVYPNTIEKMEYYISNRMENINYSNDYNTGNGIEKITFSNNLKYITGGMLDATQWYNNQTDEELYIGNLLYEYRGGTEKTSLIIKDGTIGIVNRALFYSAGLTTVTIPDSVTYIGEDAFGYCEDLTSITIPGSVTEIRDYAFEECDNLTNVTISEGVTSIGDYAFSKCDKITSVTIPDSVKSIGTCAFYFCTNLENILIPESIISIGCNAFFGTSWERNQPQGDLYIGKIYYEYNGDMPANTSVNIKEGTTQIAGGAFADCSNLTSITIPNSVTSIGDSAFNCCYNLTSITIPENVTNIGYGAFANCSSLTSINIPEGVTSIKSTTFTGCYGLTSITIPSGVTSIGKGAFTWCENLTSITIPNSVTSIDGYQTFGGCKSLTSITIPEGIISIGENMFAECSSLTGITIPDSVTSIGGNAFTGCSNLTSIIIPNSVKIIGYNAFYECEKLASVTISNGVTNIYSYAFSECSSLTSITIPSSVMELGYEVFYNCNSLTSINIKKEQDSLYDSPWGAYNATINWNYTGE